MKNVLLEERCPITMPGITGASNSLAFAKFQVISHERVRSHAEHTALLTWFCQMVRENLQIEDGKNRGQCQISQHCSKSHHHSIMVHCQHFSPTF